MPPPTYPQLAHALLQSTLLRGEKCEHLLTLVVVKSGGGPEALLEKTITNTIFHQDFMLYFKLYSALFFILQCILFSFLICIS